MSDTTPLISVIVPVYNVGAFLLPCLDSLKAQTYKNLEILLVDDGSTDGSAKTCDTYAETDHRFKVFHKENGGVCSARNLGLDIAQGEYIAFVDADDRVLPNYFEVLYRDLTEQGADAAFCDYIAVDEKGTEIPLNRVRFQEKTRIANLDTLMAYGNEFKNVCCCLFSSSRLQGHRFSNLRFGEDTLFIFDWLCTNPIVCINPYKGYIYVQRQTSASHNEAIPKIVRQSDYLTFSAHRFLKLPTKAPEIRKYYMGKYADAIHAVAYLSAQPKNRPWRQENLREHISTVLPYKDLLPGKLRLRILLYANAPWLYNLLARINDKLRG